MSKICRYNDCGYGTVQENDDEQVTCPFCRRDLGLEESVLLEMELTNE